MGTRNQARHAAALALLTAACATTPTPMPMPTETPAAAGDIAATALLPSQVDALDRAACVAQTVRDEAERYANRRARSHTASFVSHAGRDGHFVRMRDRTERAISTLSRLKHMDSVDAGAAQTLIEAFLSPDRLYARTRSAASTRASTGSVSIGQARAAAERDAAAERAVAEIRQSQGAANRYAKLAELHAEAFDAALAVERGELSDAEADAAVRRVRDAAAAWPDTEALYQEGFRLIDSTSAERCPI